jgi:hypothetical protein
LTIDASDAGVILDGGNIPEETWAPGLEVQSDGNTILGLQIINFPGAGIAVSGRGQNNTIGGDRGIGLGSLGQGNLTSGNDIGIGLWDEASLNTITGNLIGTDSSGTQALANHQAGIMIIEGASHNIIGPDNIIAHNDGSGISIGHSNSVGNAITQNSIHDNGRIGIDLVEGGNTQLAAPVIFDFDLAAGTVAGTALANCTVEIFSDRSNQGEIYEGQTTANGEGAFTFNSSTSFTGPHLTATVTDSDGNSSGFSAPTSSTGISVLLQQGNNLPKAQLHTKPSSELADNRIGGLWSGLWESDLREIIDMEVFGLGLKRVRLAVNNLDWDRADWSKPELSIDPSHDDLVTHLSDNGVTITYVLSFWDNEYRAGGREVSYPRFKTEDQIQRYLDFVRFIVGHFKGRVQYFEIWNEPNIGDCVQWIEVNDYVNLVRRAVPVIRQEYPEAKIVVGGTTNLREPESQEYLFGILSSDIMPLVDAVSWHPMYGASPEYDYYRQYYYEYPSLVQRIKDVASAHGFEGEYIADELNWWTPEFPIPDQPWTHSEAQSAKYYARSIVMHLGMDVTIGLAGVSSARSAFFPTARNLCTVMGGAEPISLPMEIDSEATNIRSYSFSLSNGDHLIALWTDGVAVDDDPGIESTVTLPDFPAQRVMGIDVLHGFEQQLIAEVHEGNLVIPDLLVKDYPIILGVTE